MLAYLLGRGWQCQRVRQRRVLAGRRLLHTERQGCDIFGCDTDGRAVYVEVKAYRGAIPISEARGLTLAQLAFLQARADQGALCLVAVVTPADDIFFVPVGKIIERGGRSLRLRDAMEDATNL